MSSHAVNSIFESAGTRNYMSAAHLHGLTVLVMLQGVMFDATCNQCWPTTAAKTDLGSSFAPRNLYAFTVAIETGHQHLRKGIKQDCSNTWGEGERSHGLEVAF